MLKHKLSFYLSLIFSLLCFLSTYIINNSGGEFLFYFSGLCALASMLIFVFSDK